MTSKSTTKKSSLRKKKTGLKKSTTKKSSPKKKKTGSRKSPYRKDFEAILGKEIYEHWLSMLKTLVPFGRTHRLSVMVAGMLQFAWDKVDHNDEEIETNKLYAAMEEASQDSESDQLAKIIASMFAEAGVKASRTNSRGGGYSIAEDAVREFYCWDMMPWE